MGTSLTLEIQFYSHLPVYYITLVACTGAKWQQYNQGTVEIAYCALVRLTQSSPRTFEDQNVQLPISDRFSVRPRSTNGPTLWWPIVI